MFITKTGKTFKTFFSRTRIARINADLFKTKTVKTQRQNHEFPDDLRQFVLDKICIYLHGICTKTKSLSDSELDNTVQMCRFLRINKIIWF